MLTLFQIVAIIRLLVAFNVPQSDINNVQSILLATVATSTVAVTPQTAPVPSPVPVQQTQQLAPSVQTAPIVPELPPAEIKTNTPAFRRGNGSPVSGTINLWVDNLLIQDNGDMVFDWRDTVKDPSIMTFWVDGVNLGSPTGTDGRYILMLDTTAYENRFHDLIVTFDDEHGQSGRAVITFRVEN